MTFALGKSIPDALLQDQLPAQNAHHQRGGEVLVQVRERFHWFGTKQVITVQVRLPPEFEQQLEGGLPGGRDTAGQTTCLASRVHGERRRGESPPPAFSSSLPVEARAVPDE